MLDAFDSFRTAVKERIASPLTGGFTITWCLCNWNILIAAISGDHAADLRLSLIRAEIEKNATLLLGIVPFRLLGLPLVLGALYAFVYPWVTGWVSGFHSRARRWSQARKWKHEDGTPVSPERYLETVRDLELARREVQSAHERRTKVAEAAESEQKRLSDELSAVSAREKGAEGARQSAVQELAASEKRIDELQAECDEARDLNRRIGEALGHAQGAGLIDYHRLLSEECDGDMSAAIVLAIRRLAERDERVDRLRESIVEATAVIKGATQRNGPVGTTTITDAMRALGAANELLERALKIDQVGRSDKLIEGGET